MGMPIEVLILRGSYYLGVPYFRKPPFQTHPSLRRVPRKAHWPSDHMRFLVEALAESASPNDVRLTTADAQDDGGFSNKDGLRKILNPGP